MGKTGNINSRTRYEFDIKNRNPEFERNAEKIFNIMYMYMVE